MNLLEVVNIILVISNITELAIYNVVSTEPFSNCLT